MAIPLLDGWNITRSADWVPWGDGGARAKVLGSADGYLVALVEADAGYQGTPHRTHLRRVLLPAQRSGRNQGHELAGGDGYAASAGSSHDDFEALEPSTYLSIFRI
jgi:hypothetical protein